MPSKTDQLECPLSILKLPGATLTTPDSPECLPNPSEVRRKMQRFLYNGFMLTEQKQSIIHSIERITPTPGVRVTCLPQIKVAWSDEHGARRPVLYEPSIIIVLQGSKRVYRGDRILSYDADNYFVSAIPLPLECETLGSKETPLYAMCVRIELSILRELVVKMKKPRRERLSEVSYATPLTEDLLGPVERLMSIVAAASGGSETALCDLQILSDSLLREIYYRALQGPHSGALFALAARHNQVSDMSSVIDLIHENYSRDISIEEMAASLNMSSTAFFQHFKELTSSSPLQYLKSLRLHKAKLFMVADGLNASEAAEKVGYKSLSQFSREFKRMFGKTPTEEVAIARAIHGIDWPEAVSVD